MSYLCLFLGKMVLYINIFCVPMIFVICANGDCAIVVCINDSGFCNR